MATPAAQRARRGYIPQEDLLIAAGRDETCVVGCDGEGEDSVTVGTIALDKARFRSSGGCFLRVVEVDRAIRGAGQDLAVSVEALT